MEKRAPKKGKKNRKHGRGLRKVQRSRFGSYAALFAASRERKLKRIASHKARFARRRARRESFETGGSLAKASSKALA